MRPGRCHGNRRVAKESQSISHHFKVSRMRQGIRAAAGRVAAAVTAELRRKDELQNQQSSEIIPTIHSLCYCMSTKRLASNKQKGKGSEGDP